MHYSETNPAPISDMPAEQLSVIQECCDCGLLSRLAPPQHGVDMRCPRCNNILRRVKPDPLNNALAWALVAACFYLVTVFTPLLDVAIYGRFHSGAIGSGPVVFDDQGYWMLSAVVFLTTIFMPLAKIAGTLIVLLTLRSCRHKRPAPHWLAGLFAVLQHVNPWIMIEVYLLGFLVAYTRLEVLAHVHIATGVYGLVGLMIAIAAMDSALDPEAVWEKIAPRVGVDPSPHIRHLLIGCDTCFQVCHGEPGDECPRCGSVLHIRKPGSMNRAWALGISAVILYVPSNIYPVMNVTKLGKVQSYTIFGGIQELAHLGLWPLAILVLTASIAIPIFKLLALGYMLVQTHFRSRTRLHVRTHLYRVIDLIGRWSMVDIFVVSILIALVRFGWFAQITPDIGATFFACVVILTLLAVKSFDPRLMWDNVERRAPYRAGTLRREARL